MAEDKKKFLDADGLKHFWEMCRLQSDEDFQTNLEIFDAMASALESLKQEVGMPEKLPDDIKSLYELVEKNKNQSVVGLNINRSQGKITATLGNGEDYVIPIIDKEDQFWLASDSNSGLVKLYFKPGNREDGTMTQKAITAELDKKVGIKIDADTLIFTK